MVYVLNKQGKPLMPTTRYGKVRRLLKEGKAVPVSNNPFTIRLKYEVENITQNIFIGLDTGRENIGISASLKDGSPIFLGELETNNKCIKLRMQERSEYRHERRRHKRNKKQRKAISNNATIKNGKDDVFHSKKKCKSIEISYPGMKDTITHKVIKGAEAQFNNKKIKEGWISPSGKQLIQMHLLLIKEVAKFLPITYITVENVCFDFQKLENENIKNWQYGKGPLYGFKDYKDYINTLQKGKCLLCNNSIEEYHHINGVKNGRYDNIKNIAGLCNNCHQGLGGVHKNKDALERLLSLKEESYPKYEIGLLNSIMPFLLEEISNYCKENDINFFTTTGYETSKKRKELGLLKTHAIDAYCISLVASNAKGKTKLDIGIWKIKHFKKKSKNIIHKRGSRKYLYSGKVVAINRNKATNQKENSLKEYMEEYSKTHTKKECDKHFHELEIIPAKRIYTFHKQNAIKNINIKNKYNPPIHAGDVVKYEKANKIKGNTKSEVFIATRIDTSTRKIRNNTKSKLIKYCKPLKSGCIRISVYNE